jgi:hypothetical protein
VKPNRPQRIVLFAYFVVLLYCFVWIPWRIQVHAPDRRYGPMGYQRVGYGWLWAGPRNAGDDSEVRFANPDTPLISLRIAAITVAGAAAILIAGLNARPKQ